MLELGEYELTGHRLVGRRVLEAADFLVTVGSLGQIIAKESLDAGMPPGRVMILPDVKAAMETLPGIIKEGDMVLIKGSRGVRLDKLVDFLTQSQLDAEGVD